MIAPELHHALYQTTERGKMRSSPPPKLPTRPKKEQRRIHRLIEDSQRKRGERAEEIGVSTINDLIDLGLPVEHIHGDPYWDKRGVDSKLVGFGPLECFELGIDFKSSKKSVEEYYIQQKQAREKGEENSFPCVPFCLGYYPYNQCLIKVLSLIVNNTEEYRRYVPEIEALESIHNTPEFREALENLITKIFFSP